MVNPVRRSGVRWPPLQGKHVPLLPSTRAQDMSDYCPESPNSFHFLTMTRVLGYMEQTRGRCEECGQPVKVHNARWVTDPFTICEEIDIDDLL